MGCAYEAKQGTVPQVALMEAAGGELGQIHPPRGSRDPTVCSKMQHLDFQGKTEPGQVAARHRDVPQPEGSLHHPEVEPMGCAEHP